MKFIPEIFRDKKGQPLLCIKEIKRLENLTIVRFKGSIDSSTIPDIEKYEKNELDRNILLDFKDVSHIDTSTVATLILLLNDLKKSHRKLGIINATEQLISVLTIERVGTLIHIYKDEKEALRELS